MARLDIAALPWPVERNQFGELPEQARAYSEFDHPGLKAVNNTLSQEMIFDYLGYEFPDHYQVQSASLEVGIIKVRQIIGEGISFRIHGVFSAC